MDKQEQMAKLRELKQQKQETLKRQQQVRYDRGIQQQKRNLKMQNVRNYKALQLSNDNENNNINDLLVSTKPQNKPPRSLFVKFEQAQITIFDTLDNFDTLTSPQQFRLCFMVEVYQCVHICFSSIIETQFYQN